MSYWTAPPQWQDETAFILCGGASVRSQNLELLRGRKVIVINSSYETVPWADVLYFNDSRWWRYHRDKIEKFAGLVVTTAPTAHAANIRKMQKVKPPGLTEDRSSLSVQNTSTTGAVNLAVHFGVRAIVFLGLDGRGVHHHKPHPWPQKEDCWAKQREDLASIRKPLAKRGIEVVNCSPGSALADLWPVINMEKYLEQERMVCTGV